MKLVFIYVYLFRRQGSVKFGVWRKVYLIVCYSVVLGKFRRTNRVPSTLFLPAVLLSREHYFHYINHVLFLTLSYYASTHFCFIHCSQTLFYLQKPLEKILNKLSFKLCIMRCVSLWKFKYCKLCPSLTKKKKTIRNTSNPKHFC